MTSDNPPGQDQTAFAELRRTITIRDVAKLAGVDRSVVSRIVNNDPGLRVRPATRRRVEEAVIALDYRPSPIARGLRTQRSDTVTLLVPDIANPVVARIVTGTQRKAAELGKALVLGPTVSSEGAIRDFGDLLRRGRTDGLLIAVARLEDRAVRDLEQLDLPVVLVNRRSHSSFPHVVLDDESAAAMATSYLLERGHESIVHIMGDLDDAETAARRRDGFVGAMAAAEIHDADRLSIEAGYSAEAGFRACCAVLGRRDRPTALFCASTGSAIGAIAAAHELGLSVPKDVSVVGFNDTSLAPFVPPGITVVDLPLEVMGHEAIDKLGRLIGGESVSSVTLPYEPAMVERGSVAPPR